MQAKPTDNFCDVLDFKPNNTKAWFSFLDLGGGGYITKEIVNCIYTKEIFFTQV